MFFSYFTLFYVLIIFSLRKGSSSTKISGEATAPTLDNCQNSERQSPWVVVSEVTKCCQVKKFRIFLQKLIFYIFKFLLHGLAHKVKKNQNFFIFCKLTWRSSTLTGLRKKLKFEKSFIVTRKQESLVFFIFSRHSNKFLTLFLNIFIYIYI